MTGPCIVVRAAISFFLKISGMGGVYGSSRGEPLNDKGVLGYFVNGVA